MCMCMHHKTITMTIVLSVSADPGVCCNQLDFGLCSSLVFSGEKADGHCRTECKFAINLHYSGIFRVLQGRRLYFVCPYTTNHKMTSFSVVKAVDKRWRFFVDNCSMYKHQHVVHWALSCPQGIFVISILLLVIMHLQSYEDGPQVSGVGEYPCSVWHPLRSTAVYIIAWYACIKVHYSKWFAFNIVWCVQGATNCCDHGAICSHNYNWPLSHPWSCIQVHLLVSNTHS